MPVDLRYSNVFRSKNRGPDQCRQSGNRRLNTWISRSQDRISAIDKKLKHFYKVLFYFWLPGDYSEMPPFFSLHYFYIYTEKLLIYEN